MRKMLDEYSMMGLLRRPPKVIIAGTSTKIDFMTSMAVNLFGDLHYYFGAETELLRSFNCPFHLMLFGRERP